jgi:adenylosuccinate synthase
MKKYIKAIEQELETDIAVISIGPNRNDTILLDNDLF